MEDAVIVSAVRTPVGSFGGQLQGRRRDRAGRARGPRGARAGRDLRRRGGRGRARLRPAGGPRAEPGAPGRDRRGDPEGGALDDDQHALRIGPQVGRDRVADDPRGRRRRRRGRRHGEHDAFAVPVADGTLRRAHGRRRADRLDGPRRAPDAFNDIHMGVTAENLADQYGIGREEQDEFAATASRRPSARSPPGSSRTRSCRSRCRARAARASSTPTSTRGRGRPPRRWRSSARPSAATAAP